jgi:hypothetical protein
MPFQNTVTYAGETSCGPLKLGASKTMS